MADTFVNDFLRTLRELTIRCVGVMPEDQMGYRPAATSRSFAEITLHMLGAHWNLLNRVSGRDEAPPAEFKLENFPTRDSLVAALRAGQERAARIVPTLTEEQLERLVDSPFGPQMPARIFLNVMMVHEAEHRGNLVVMAKACGANPPDITAVRAEAAQAKGN